MKMIPTANKMINCEQWESLQSSAVEANPGQGWVWHFFMARSSKAIRPTAALQSALYLWGNTALHYATHKQSCEEQAVLSAAAAAAQQGNTGKGWLKVFQGGGLSQDCSGLSAKMKGGRCCEISPCLVYAQPYHRRQPKFTFSHFTRDPILHMAKFTWDPNLHITKFTRDPNLHNIKFTRNLNLHKNFTQHQICTDPNLHKNQIYTDPKLTQTQFYTKATSTHERAHWNLYTREK